MEQYKNLGGSSGVIGYEIGPGFIRVQFTGGAVYRYTNASAGEAVIERMKSLARDGRGLGSYISKTVKNNYESRESADEPRTLIEQLSDLLVGTTITSVNTSAEGSELPDLTLKLSTGEKLTIIITSDGKHLWFAKEEMFTAFKPKAAQKP